MTLRRLALIALCVGSVTAATPIGRTAVLVASRTATRTYVHSTVRLGDRRSHQVRSMAARAVDLVASPDGRGYWLVDGAGQVFSFGDARSLGQARVPGSSAVTSMANSDQGSGGWLVTSLGGVYPLAGSRGFGSLPSVAATSTVVAAAAPLGGGGYWLVASDGQSFPFGDAGRFGRSRSAHLNRPIVGMATTPHRNGYWLVASDGGIFSYGDARFHGSAGGTRLNRPIVGMASTPDGHGYWLVASDGGVFSYGDANFHGSAGGIRLNQPIVGIAASSDGKGYWLVASDGGIFSYGNAHFYGAGHYAQPHYGYGLLPPANPSWNIASRPDMYSAGSCQWTGNNSAVCTNPCVTMSGNSWSYSNDTASCIDYQLAAINHARSLEGVRPMVLPRNWTLLTRPEQLFVLADLERVDRGLPAYVGLDPQLNSAAQSAAAAGQDPNAPPNFPVARDPQGYTMVSGSWSGGYSSMLESDYGWMYQDGWGGSSSNTTNIACNGPSAAACWGHRDELLGSDPGFDPGVGLYCTDCVAGTAYSSTSSSGWANSAVDLIVAPAYPIPVGQLTFTWVSELRSFSSAP